MTERLARHEYDPAKDVITQGVDLHIDPKRELFIDTPQAAAANSLLRGEYRKPFVMPQLT